jgi:hypothetical protein
MIVDGRVKMIRRGEERRLYNDREEVHHDRKEPRLHLQGSRQAVAMYASDVIISSTLSDAGSCA